MKERYGREKKRILIVEIPQTCSDLYQLLTRWGYEPVELHHTNSDSVLDMIAGKEFDLLIIAKDLTIKGPSRSDDWRESENINVAYSFGMETLSRLRVRNQLPVIVLAHDRTGDSWMRTDDGRLDWVILTRIERDEGNFFDRLKKAVEEFLGEGVGIED